MSTRDQPFSPPVIIDLADIDSPVLSYARWFSNTYGAAPNTDTFVVEYSTNGSSWSILETVGPKWPRCRWWVGTGSSGILMASSVEPSRCSCDFTASDIGSNTQSVVEAGVDGIIDQRNRL